MQNVALCFIANTAIRWPAEPFQNDRCSRELERVAADSSGLPIAFAEDIVM